MLKYCQILYLYILEIVKFKKKIIDSRHKIIFEKGQTTINGHNFTLTCQKEKWFLMYWI